MQRARRSMLLLLAIGLFSSACSESSFARPTVTPQLTNTFTPTNSPMSETLFDKNGFEMIFIPAGEFSMGNNSIGGRQPAHDVYLDEYYIDKDVVNNVDFVKFLNENLEDILVQSINGVIQDPPSLAGTEIYGQEVYLHEDLVYCIDCLGWDSSLPSQDDWDKSIIWNGESFSILDGREKFPVTMVNWHGAQGYCSWRGAHLPTEAEWVKAFNQGMKRNNLVTEWVFDWFAEDYYSNSPYKSPQGPEEGTFRLIIGSSPYPNYMSPNFGFWDISFRCSRASLD